MPEEWRIIEDLPRYSISNYGEVMNNHTGRILRQSPTWQGASKVVFKHAGTISTRSVKVMVANAFVEGRDELFNTPIHLDGDQRNNFAYNLAWRPRWFAWKYSRQLKNIPGYINFGPIYEVISGDIYSNIYDACLINGLLFYDVWVSLIYELRTEIFPTHQIFARYR